MSRQRKPAVIGSQKFFDSQVTERLYTSFSQHLQFDKQLTLYLHFMNYQKKALTLTIRGRSRLERLFPSLLMVTSWNISEVLNFKNEAPPISTQYWPPQSSLDVLCAIMKTLFRMCMTDFNLCGISDLPSSQLCTQFVPKDYHTSLSTWVRELQLKRRGLMYTDKLNHSTISLGHVALSNLISISIHLPWREPVIKRYLFDFKKTRFTYQDNLHGSGSILTLTRDGLNY